MPDLSHAPSSAIRGIALCPKTGKGGSVTPHNHPGGKRRDPIKGGAKSQATRKSVRWSFHPPQLSDEPPRQPLRAGKRLRAAAATPPPQSKEPLSPEIGVPGWRRSAPGSDAAFCEETSRGFLLLSLRPSPRSAFLQLRLPTPPPRPQGTSQRGVRRSRHVVGKVEEKGGNGREKVNWGGMGCCVSLERSRWRAHAHAEPSLRVFLA